MPEIIAVVIGLVVGFILGSLVARARAGKSAVDQRVDLETRLARAEAELAAARRESDAKLGVLENARKQLEESFKALASDALRANSESFVGHARTQMEALMSRADGSLEKRREAIEKLLTPIGEVLKRYEQQLREVEKERGESYVDLRRQVTSLMEHESRLQAETHNLVNALKLPQVRGRWGEMSLRRTAELAGMVRHCDFTEQVTIKETGQRPDMIVHLPAGREIVVDSKVSLHAYLAAIEAATEEESEAHLKDHARQVRAHMTSLASKEYAKQFEKAPDFTVLFMPGESFFSAAVRVDPKLIEDAMDRGVIIATPTTLVALLHAVAHGWRQAQMEENARMICEEGRQLFERTRVLLEHFADIGPALRRAVEKFNDAAGSLTARFVPSARRLKELGAGSSKDLPALEPVDQTPQSPDVEEE